jgi:hypothetical protein
MRKVLIIATAAILLTSGCSPSYTCQHDYGLSQGTADFSNCMVNEEALNLQRAAALMQLGQQLRQQAYPHPPAEPEPLLSRFCPRKRLFLGNLRLIPGAAPSNLHAMHIDNARW